MNEEQLEKRFRKRYTCHRARVKKRCYGHPGKPIHPGEIYYKRKTKTYCSDYFKEQLISYIEIKKIKDEWYCNIKCEE